MPNKSPDPNISSPQQSMEQQLSNDGFSPSKEKVSSTIYSLKSNVIFIIALALFFLLFFILYTPTFGIDENATVAWNNSKDFCIPILSSIVLVCVAVSRTLLCIFTRRNMITKFEYLVWQIVEVIISGLFSALFLALYFKVVYFEILPRTLAVSVGILIYPYFIYWILVERHAQDIRLHEANKAIVMLKSNQTDGPDVIRFIDEKGNVRLIVPAEHVISIESAGNYVTILYEDSGKLVRFALRNTLKAIEGLSNSLIRTHRSYFVNLHHIKLLQKDTSGVFAEIDTPGVDPIPISKNYAAEVAQRFSSQG
ncbi:MAG: LytTR family transcriptional regulator DNA-binding domain-containing protein [Bacteroidales bacterium]|nr:LytTR family transcriptional regulator DNA-binding domain-containing protein [Candidatus Colimorpha pelethequi]